MGNTTTKDIASSNVFITHNIILEVNDLIRRGIALKASDIHIQDYYGKCLIEYRVNGVIKYHV